MRTSRLKGHSQPVRTRLERNEPVYGIWSILNSTASVEIMGEAGLDFVILDSEHGSLSFSDLEELSRAARGYEIETLIRVSRLDTVEIQKALDIGVEGILVPQIKTASDARNVVAACHLAPQGSRGFNPFTRAGHYRGQTESVVKQSDALIIGLLIENREAVENIDSILAVEGLSLIYIGVYDLSCSLGFRGQVAHPSVLEVVDVLMGKAREKGVSVGMMVESRKDSMRYISRGADFFVFRPDTMVFFLAIQGLLEG